MTNAMSEEKRAAVRKAAGELLRLMFEDRLDVDWVGLALSGGLPEPDVVSTIAVTSVGDVVERVEYGLAIVTQKSRGNLAAELTEGRSMKTEAPDLRPDSDNDID